MEKPKDGLEGLRSLLLRYKRINLAFLGLIAIVAATIVIWAQSGGELPFLEPSKGCIKCHKPEAAEYVHTPYKDRDCTECHSAHKKGEKSKFKNPVEKLCLNSECHGPIGEEISRHFSHLPAKKRRCLECHKNHVSSHKSLLVKNPEELCIECHRVMEELKMVDKHQPFERRQCLSCHVAHGSVFDKGLRNQQKKLCIICHINIARAEKGNFQHLPFEEGRCTDCHGAHATNYQSQLLDSRPRLCYTCHSEIEPLFSETSHHPAKEGVFTCSNCHNPHSDQYRFLLSGQGSNFCFKCHSDKRGPYVESAHYEVVRLGGVGYCTNCHKVHGSDYSPLLIQDSVSVCKACHADWAHPKISHPVGSTYVDKLRARQLTCSSSCHDPHGTYQRNMLKQVPDGLCLKCHKPSELQK